MLGTMIGYGALVLEDLPADNPDRELMGKVVEAGIEAKHLVAELLEMARKESMRIEAGLKAA